MTKMTKPTTGDFTKTPGWLDWYTGPSKPRFKLPAGAVDAHCHVFGPGAEFPYAPERKYTPCDASAEQLFALRDHLGFDRNVIVQATCHGADNSALVDALQRSGGRARGVATVRRDVTDEQLAGIRKAIDGKSALWFYAPGYVNQMAAAENVTRLLGFTVTETPEGTGARIALADAWDAVARRASGF